LNARHALIFVRFSIETVGKVERKWTALGAFSIIPWHVGAFKVSLLCGNEECLAPEVLAFLDWDDLIEYSMIFVCSVAMRGLFPSDGDPVALTSDQIGAPIRPGGHGYMTLSDAAYWIATEGGTKRIVVRDVSVWREAFAELLPRMQSGQVRVVGRRRGADFSEAINPESFVNLAVDYPYVDTPMALLLCEEPHIRCCGCGTAKLDQSSDEIWGSERHSPEWSYLQVNRADVREWWKFGDYTGGMARRKSKAGTKAIWDWDDIELFVLKMLEENGDFENPADRVRGWKSQNDLIDHVRGYISKRGDPEPSDSTLKDRVAPMIARWRGGKAEK
jgi:hypothetical protein